MGKVGENFKTVRGGYQGGSNVLQGSDTGVITLWLVYMGNFGGNREEIRGHKHEFFRRQIMGKQA